MKLSDIPLEDLQRGHRVSGVHGQGTIYSVNPETGQIAFGWDSGTSSYSTARDRDAESYMYEGSWAMYCIVSEAALKAMNGNRGKLGAQTGHGYQFAGWNSQDRFPEHHAHYRNSMSAAKICLKAPDADALQDIYEKFKPICGVALIKDEGRTVFSEPTVTVLGIGPLRKDKYGDMRLPEIQRGGIAGNILI